MLFALLAACGPSAPQVLDAPPGMGPGPVEPDPMVTESYVGGFGPVDVLFVIDQTPDARYLVDRLWDAAPAFFEAVGDLDAQVGVVTTDMNDPFLGQGRLLNADDAAFTRSSDPDPASGFRALLDAVPVAGGSSVKARASLWTTIEFRRDTPTNAGFFRGGPVVAVMVSNDADESGGVPVSPSELADWSHETGVTVHGIVPVGTSCEEEVGSVFGRPFTDDIRATGGLAVDVCAPQLSGHMSTLGGLARMARGELLLTWPAEPDSIRVSIDFPFEPVVLVPCATCDVRYVPTRNAVAIDLDVPQGTPIQVTYTQRE